VGGAAGSSTAAYFLSNANQILMANPLPLASTVPPTALGTISMTYLTYDIAREGTDNGNSGTGDIWVACDHPDSPIRAYNPNGVLTFASDLVEDVKGIACSSTGGHRYVWVSNPTDNTIYQIDLDYGLGVEGGGDAGAPLVLRASSNPFQGSVTISAAGFTADASIEVFGLDGRLVTSSAFQGAFTWDGSNAPSGVYMARVHDSTGAEAHLSLVSAR